MPRPDSRRRRSTRPKRKPSGPAPSREPVTELAPTVDPPEVASFEEFDLGEEIQRAVRNMDIVKPTPIQSLAIGPVLEGRDVIAKAETGTGKTLAFGAPMMAKIDPARATVLGLVLCPTRELAQQVATVLEALALPREIRVALVVGGDPMHPQINQLQAGAQVVVGTPGRVLDLHTQRFLQFPWTEFAVLDEADKMFEIGFADDVRKILGLLPEERQTLLFSATFPAELLRLARAETRNPVEVATKKGTVTAKSIAQSWMAVDEDERPLALTRLFEQSAEDDIFLVFCERRTEVDRLLRRLERLPFGVKALHGGYDQASRFRVMSAFREGSVKALIATDVASRGLDVDHVTHVVNYSVPRELEDYAHRIGRTGRAGRSGIAITFVPHTQARKWRALLGQAKWEIPQEDPPESTRRARARGDRDERGRGRDRDRDRSRGRDRDEGRERDRNRDRGRGDDRPRGRNREERPAREEERPRESREERRPRRERNETRGERQGAGARTRRPEEDRGRGGEWQERGRGEERSVGREESRDRKGRETRDRGEDRENRGRERRGARDDDRPRDDRPREERRPRSRRSERDDEGRRDRERSGGRQRGGPRERDDRKRDERPREQRERADRPAHGDRERPAEPARSEGSSFGAMLDEPRESSRRPKKERRPRSKPDRSTPAAQDTPKREAADTPPRREDSDAGGGSSAFGSGL